MIFKKKNKKLSIEENITIECKAAVKKVLVSQTFNEGIYLSFIHDEIRQYIENLGKPTTPDMYKAAMDLLVDDDFLVIQACELDILHTLHFHKKIKHPCKKDVCEYYKKKHLDITPDYYEHIEHREPVDIIADSKFYSYDIEIEYYHNDVLYNKTIHIKQTTEQLTTGDYINISFNSSTPDNPIYIIPDNPLVTKVKEHFSKINRTKECNLLDLCYENFEDFHRVYLEGKQYFGDYRI